MGGTMVYGRKLWTLCLLGGLAMTGCSSHSDGAGSSSAAATTDPFKMPTAIVSYENAGHWGSTHLAWHTERQWDLLDKSDLAWAKKQGWKRADIQEGQAGNGFEFLVMHRAMLTILRAKFPSDVDLFVGWTTPPTDPNDSSSPIPSDSPEPGAFDPNMLTALQTIDNNITQFTTDDDFGLYVETNLRPVASNPAATSSDPTTGVHNYIHNRFSDSNSPIDMGDPSKNLGNKIFWRLHGWIDARWSVVRANNGLSDSDPTFQAALKNAEDMYTEGMNMGGNLGATANSTPPTSLSQFFENENDWGSNAGGMAGMNAGLTFPGASGGDDAGAPLPSPSGSDDAGAGDAQADAAPADPGDAASSDPCQGMADGNYCGGDGVQGDASTLYTCSSGTLANSQVCANGCSSTGDQDGLDQCN
jgi:hypothetical protein